MSAPRRSARHPRSSMPSTASSSSSISESSRTPGSSSICNKLLRFPVPDHDHAHHPVVLVRVRHRRALDEQAVALEADEAGLLAADPGLVPGGFDLGDDLAALDPVAAGI